MNLSKIMFFLLKYIIFLKETYLLLTYDGHCVEVGVCFWLTWTDTGRTLDRHCVGVGVCFWLTGRTLCGSGGVFLADWTDSGRIPDGHCVGVGVCFWLCGCAGVFWLCGGAGVFLAVWVCGCAGGVCGGLGVSRS